MDKATRQCEWCGADYVPARRTSRTCGSRCRTALNRRDQNAKASALLLAERGETRTCAECGEAFRPPRIDSRLCSQRCRSQETGRVARQKYSTRQSQRTTPECNYCGKPFIPVRSDARYCSRRCVQRVSYLNSRAERISRVAEYSRLHPERRRAVAANYRDRRRARESEGAGIAPADWARTVRRFLHSCAYCGACGPLHMDHVVPLSRGGTHSIGNVLPACVGCNLGKHAMFLAEWKLRKKREEARSWQTRDPATATQMVLG